MEDWVRLKNDARHSFNLSTTSAKPVGSRKSMEDLTWMWMSKSLLRMAARLLGVERMVQYRMAWNIS